MPYATPPAPEAQRRKTHRARPANAPLRPPPVAAHKGAPHQTGRDHRAADGAYRLGRQTALENKRVPLNHLERSQGDGVS